MEGEIKAIIFDVGGVLALSKTSWFLRGRTKGVHEFVSKKLKISLDQWLDSIDSPYSKAIEGKITKNQALKIISHRVKKFPEELEKILIKAYKKNFKINKELYNLAFELKKQKYKIAILSDQWPVSQEVVMPKKLISQFNPVIVSCEVGMRKPNIKIYELILKKLNLPAKNTLFIDNQEWNLHPARYLGMHTILFRNNKQLSKHLKQLGILG